MSSPRPQGTEGKGEGEGEERVVMRKSLKPAEQLYYYKPLEETKDGEKRVKWSESTDLRERMKEYRRSQMSMTLDYHHIAIEEERERAGVKEWRTSLQLHDSGPQNQSEDNDDENDGGDGPQDSCNKEEEDSGDDSSGIDSDQFEPSADEDLDRKLREIKAVTTKHTLLPAYRAALHVYRPWLSENKPSLSPAQLQQYQSQRDLYSQVVTLYDEWSDGESTDKAEARFDKITALIQQAKDLGEPPDTVGEAITEALTCPENVKKQKEVYDQMVQDMMAAFEESVQI